jgi:apolipoprotein N-acyltransferase
VGELAHSLKAPVIAGSLGVDRDPAAEQGYAEYDSASLFAADGNYAGRYDKIHLVPWGEYTPYPAVFGFVHKLTEGIGAMTRGHVRSVYTTRGHAYGTFICYESIFGTEVREFAKNGAEVLVNISDDGWYGDSGAPWQHLNMARMRAIENRRWLLRDTNTGITTAIDPYGRMAAQAPRHVRAAFAFPFDYTQGTTFYTRHGDWFAWLCALLTLAALGAVLTQRKSRSLRDDKQSGRIRRRL